jgi:hypothetical protein
MQHHRAGTISAADDAPISSIGVISMKTLGRDDVDEVGDAHDRRRGGL